LSDFWNRAALRLECSSASSRSSFSRQLIWVRAEYEGDQLLFDVEEVGLEVDFSEVAVERACVFPELLERCFSPGPFAGEELFEVAEGHLGLEDDDVDLVESVFSGGRSGR